MHVHAHPYDMFFPPAVTAASAAAATPHRSKLILLHLCTDSAHDVAHVAILVWSWLFISFTPLLLSFKPTNTKHITMFTYILNLVDAR